MQGVTQISECTDNGGLLVRRESSPAAGEAAGKNLNNKCSNSRFKRTKYDNRAVDAAQTKVDKILR